MKAAALFLDRISFALNRIALSGAVLAVLVMVFAASWQVITRYLFDAPPVWTEELARRAMVWAGMLGASAAFRYRADPTLFPGMLAVGGNLGKLLAVLRGTGVAIFAIPVIWYSVFGPNMMINLGFIGRSLGRQADMIPVSMAWFTSAVPIAFTLIMIHMIAGVVTRLANLEQAEEQKQKDVME
ncbi:TRAP transporter small permease [Sneathiella chinensis]|uniref:TRAP transporter small permease protein n=1 Tax=Sneathiella chinensis TaxID=349750 RepID=A0ABQ5TYR3_9PROT|nr:TRAP transporter small permease subunit [Sneathiella chinensis]GLQ05117.1 hypothetical protein GCM10007924_03380 [Sneathiella chinensis]